eukprot:scaffold7732_cov122-Isochrysis_galbana.AAC.5
MPPRSLCPTGGSRAAPGFVPPRWGGVARPPAESRHPAGLRGPANHLAPVRSRAPGALPSDAALQKWAGASPRGARQFRPSVVGGTVDTSSLP